MFSPSKYQADFFEFVENGKGSCVLEAVAGSGKTTSVIESLPYVKPGQSVRLLAFNAAIAKELQERVVAKGLDPRFIQASTFHSLGYGTIRKYLEGKKVRMGKIDGGKCRTLARNMLTPEDYELYGDFACKMVDLAKGEGIGPLVPDTMDAWYAVLHHHDIQLDADGAEEEVGIEIARKLLDESNKQALRGNIDFNDMLYCVLVWKLKIWQNDWVFIDEAQDTNPTRRALAKLALKPGGRLVAVGDPRQAIYGFTGASHDAIDLIRKEFNAVQLPLTVSYRCAKSIIAKAQTIVPHIEAFDGSPEGAVDYLTIDKALPFFGSKDAILCRNTAPLIKLAYQLIGKGVGCRVLGRDIGAGLVVLIKKAKAKGIDALTEKLSTYRDREVAKFTAKGEEQKADALNDRIESIFTVIDSLDENSRTVPALISAIEGMFSDNGGCLTLSTIHKSKGREFPIVGILRPDLSPSKWARQDWQMGQEENLMYVAYTRAMEHLIFIETPPAGGQ